MLHLNRLSLLNCFSAGFNYTAKIKMWDRKYRARGTVRDLDLNRVKAQHMNSPRSGTRRTNTKGAGITRHEHA